VIGGSGNDRFKLRGSSANNDLDGLSGRDEAVLDTASSGTSCLRIERVIDFAGNRRACS
jgi:hypothetical protein